MTLPEECAPHCDHETARSTTTFGESGQMLKFERCCRCGRAVTLHLIRVPAGPPHGPFAPPVWSLKKKP